MNEPFWLDRQIVILLHSESLVEHGGSSGIRDPGLLDSALARPRNKFAYEPQTDIAALAASYGFGLAKNHAFVDGNKRIAFIATAMFLRQNGQRLFSTRVDEIHTMQSLAAGQLSEDEFTAWIRDNSKRVGR